MASAALTLTVTLAVPQAYTANMATFLTVKPKPVRMFNSLQDIENANEQLCVSHTGPTKHACACSLTFVQLTLLLFQQFGISLMLVTPHWHQNSSTRALL